MTDRRAWILAALAVLALAAPAAAQRGHRWIDPHGHVTWSDQPPPADATVEPPRDAGPAVVSVAPSVADPAEAAARPAKPVTVDEFMQVIGLTRQLPSLSQQLAEQFQSGQGRLSPADRAAAARVLKATLEAGRLRHGIRTELARQADAAKMQAIAAWYRGPIGARVAAAAGALGTPAGREALTAFGKQLAAHPAPPPRRALLEQLDWIDGETDGAVEVILAAARGMTRTLNDALPAERRQRPGTLERQFELARPQLRSAVQPQMLASMLFVYRDLSDDEVRQSVAFHATEPARWFDRVLKQALTRAVREAMERSARELVRVIPLERWQAAADPGASR